MDKAYSNRIRVSIKTDREHGRPRFFYLNRDKTLLENIELVKQKHDIGEDVIFADRGGTVWEHMKDIKEDDLIYLDPVKADSELYSLIEKFKLERDPFNVPEIKPYLVNDQLDLKGRVSEANTLHTLLERDQPTKVTTVDLSNNNLYDLGPIIDFVRSLVNCHTVNLSGNYFCESSHQDELLYTLLDITTIKTVVIIGNPLATAKRKDLYETLEASRLKKLIWIPKRFVNDQNAGWRRVIKNVDIQKMVETVHNSYYSASDIYSKVCI